MNIGLSTSVIQRGRSGIAQYVFGLLQGLRPFAHRHRFLLFVLEKDIPLFDFVREQMTLIPVSERFRPPAANIFWHQAFLPSLASQHELDVLHIPSYRRLPFAAPCPVIATIHDLAPFHVRGKYDFLRMFYGRRVVRRLARRLPAIIAVSSFTARDLVRFFQVDPGRIRVVHNGIDHHRFHPGDTACARKIAATRHGLTAPFFLYVARLEHPAKNHLRLIEAFNDFKQETASDTMLVLAGSDWHGAGAIHQAIRNSPFARDIRALGFVPDAELPNLYRAAEAMVYPSLFEGFGLPPVEAMACGCPVISSDRGSLGEVAGPAARIVNPEDPAEIREAIKEISGAAPERRAGIQTAGIIHARQFTWAQTAEATMQAYRKLPSRGRKGTLRPDAQPAPIVPGPNHQA